MSSLGRRIGSFLGFSVLSLTLVGGTSAIWGALVIGNTRTTPSIPWSLPLLFVMLWLVWQYLSGRGWPATTSRSRKLLLRANPVSREALAWSIVAGLFAIIALAGFWIVAFRLFPMQANLLLPAQFTSSRILIATIIIGASILAPISEESGIRGYLQTSLERNFKPATAVAMSSTVFAVAHVTQGMALPKLVFYFLVGVTFGTLAYLNDSILPVIPVHIAGDLIFFLFVWPHDRARSLVWRTGADLWFWIHIVQMIVFTALAVLVFRRLNQTRQSTGAFDQCSVQPQAP